MENVNYSEQASNEDDYGAPPACLDIIPTPPPQRGRAPRADRVWNNDVGGSAEVVTSHERVDKSPPL